MKGLIAECGNHHFGDLNKARLMVKTAHECGVDYVKFQAIDSDWFVGGSMPHEFYKQCDLGLQGYLELFEYGKSLGMPVFFSVFGPKYAFLMSHLQGVPYKISGAQFTSFKNDELSYWNKQKRNPVIVSIPDISDDALKAKTSCISKMHPMYVTGYLPERVDLSVIGRYREILGKPVGYSDHSVGILNCFLAGEHYGCLLIEKHFNLWEKQSFNGQIYRDSLHAADSMQIERLANFLASQRGEDF